MSVKVLFVCMGNICRSPTAEAVFRKQVQVAQLESRISIDSAGTGDWHVGKKPDQRSCQAAALRGYDLQSLKARQVTKEDFQRFDLILAMDHDNLAYLQALRPADSHGELDLFLRRYRLGQDVVPDPYFGGEDGFEQVLDLVERASTALLDEVRERL
nr:low molecular weight protein-tyrosine-phosphatase [Stutzerimonas stutzeri]